MWLSQKSYSQSLVLDPSRKYGVGWDSTVEFINHYVSHFQLLSKVYKNFKDFMSSIWILSNNHDQIW